MFKTDYSKKPIGFRWRSNTLFIVATVGIGLFTDLFLYGLVVPILPFILEDSVGVPENEVQSYVSGLLAVYAAASVLFSPLAGFIADRTKSRQAPYLGGLVALIGATTMFFLGKSIAVLVIARILQGASTAFVWTVGLALCIDTVGPENLGKTIGTIFSFVSIGELVAPILGGVIYNKSNEWGVLGLSLGILVIDLIMRVLVIEHKTAARYIEANPSLRQARDGAEQSENEDDQEATQETPLLDGQDRRQEDKDDEFLIPDGQPAIIRKIPVLYTLTSPSLLVAQLTALGQAVILAAFDATVPTHAQELYGFDSLKAGLLFAPLCGVNFVGGPIAGWCIDRYGTKPVAVFGFGYLVIILALLRIPGPEFNQVYLLGGLMGLAGAGLATIGAPSIVEAGAIVDKYYKRNPDFFGEQGPYAQLYAINSMVFCFGLSIGPVVAGALKESIGYGNMNAVLAAFSGLIAIASFIWLGGKPKVLQKRS